MWRLFLIKIISLIDFLTSNTIASFLPLGNSSDALLGYCQEELFLTGKNGCIKSEGNFDCHFIPCAVCIIDLYQI